MDGTSGVARRQVARWTGVLMVVAAVSFGAASTVHWGVPVLGLRDPFPGARVPEAVIGVVLLGGAAAALARVAHAWGIAVAATGFAILGTLVGLRFTIGGGVPGDIVYHAAILAALVVIMVALVTGGGRRTPRRPAQGSRRPRRTTGA
ncbi:MAG TPA: hypothetical protein VGL93_02040 [Streptosporangiaceae bacterium]|jgi:peptidoglycan/LPS O-acetylase OafA/YrhL